MPKLPDYTSLGGQGGIQSRGIVQAPENPAIEAVGQLGKQVEGMANEYQNRIDDREVTEAITEFENAQRDYLRTGDNAVLNRQNANAVGISKETNDWWDKKQTEIRGKLKNTLQETVFNKYATSQRLSVLDSVANHERVQIESSATNSLISRIDSGIENASVMWDQPNIVSQKRNEINDAVNALGSMKGWDAATLSMKREDAMNRFHVGQIAAQIDIDPQGAQDYFNKHSDELNVKTRSVMQDQLKTGLLRLKSQQKADEILGSTSDMKRQLEQANAIKNPELRDEVTNRINRMNSNLESARRQTEADALDAGKEVLARGGSISEIPISTWHKVSGDGKLALQQIERTRTSGREVPSGGVAYYKLLRAAEDSPDEFASIPFEEIAPFVAPSEREKLFNRQKEIRELGGSVGAASIDDIIDRAAAGIGLDKKLLTNPAGGEEVRHFYRNVDDRIKIYQESTGKKATPQDYERITDEMAIEVLHRKSRFKFDVEQPAYLMQVDGVPQALVPIYAGQIRKLLDSKGDSRKVTIQDIRDIHKQKLEDAKNGQ